MSILPPGEEPAAGAGRWPSRSVAATVAVLVALGTVPVLVPLLAIEEPEPARVATAADPTGGAVTGGPAPRPVPLPGAAADGAAALPTPPPRVPTATPTGAPTATRPAAPPAPRAPAGPAARPDLVVVAVGWLPEDPRSGYTVTFRATVRNAGPAAVPAGDPGVTFRVDGVLVSWSRSDTSPLGPGEQRTYTADGGPAGSTWQAGRGRHVLAAAVDSAGRVPEADERNNAAVAVLDVPGPGERRGQRR